jgi:uncharacterized cupredoxin-like copper-binding protein
MGKLLKEILKPMSYMIISMYGGMSIGLTVGVLLGTVYQGDLYFSTLLAISFGALAGLSIGLIDGPISSAEGLMAGLMGGMMGAMLGEMITPAQSMNMLKIFSMISISSIILFFVLPRENSTQQHVSKRWLLQPLSFSVLILAFFFLGEQLSQSAAVPSPNNAHSHHKTDQGQSEDVDTITILAANMKYKPSTITLKKDSIVKIDFQNQDDVEHDIEIKEFAHKPLETQAHGHHSNHSNIDFHLHAAAKETNQLTFIPTQKGEFEFYCTIPGHKESGMTGTFYVN